VLAEAAGQIAELVVLVVRHHASGWVREIARKDEDSQIEASFDPESGIVTVYEGRREFKALERAARKAGLPKSRVREYLPYRMLEVEVAANTVYNWAAQQILARRLTEERPSDPIQYAASVHHEAQALRRLDRALSDFKRYRAGRNQPVHLQGRRHVLLRPRSRQAAGTSTAPTVEYGSGTGSPCSRKLSTWAAIASRIKARPLGGFPPPPRSRVDRAPRTQLVGPRS
jgi:hypothetical protein